MNTDKRNDRPEAYPRPTETDKQLQNQPEYIDEHPNEFHDKSISDIPVNNDKEQNTDPSKPTEGYRAI
jgi:hypothetical protein